MVNVTGCFNNTYFVVENYKRDLASAASIVTESTEKRVKWRNPMKGGFERLTYLTADGTEIIIYRNKTA